MRACHVCLSRCPQVVPTYGSWTTQANKSFAWQIPFIKHLRRLSYVVQELGSEVGAVGPLDGVARQSVLDVLLKTRKSKNGRV